VVHHTMPATPATQHKAAAPQRGSRDLCQAVHVRRCAVGGKVVHHTMPPPHPSTPACGSRIIEGEDICAKQYMCGVLQFGERWCTTLCLH
jgi:hypothetical protein